MSEVLNSLKYNDFFNKIIFPEIHLMDLIEIFIIVLIIYCLMSHIKDTRAWVVLKGVFVLMFFYAAAYLLSFTVIMTIFQTLMGIIAVGIVILFQKELRKFLEGIGNRNLKFRLSKENIQEKYISDKSIESIIDACLEMSLVKTGALIVLKKEIPLGEYISTGITLNAEISSALLQQIFEHNTPLHDGAVIIENNKIISATCYLPLTENPSVSKELGTRHRAGIGISETTDCIVIMVSEETGGISIAENGKISRSLSEKLLRKKLESFQQKNTSKVKIQDMGKSIIVKNKKFKVLSLIIGIFIWIAFININNPATIKTIDNIPIKITNGNTFTEAGKTYSIADDYTAKIVIKGRRSQVDKLSVSDFKAICDLSHLSEINTITADIKGPDGIQIIENNNYYNVVIEDLSTIEHDVSVETDTDIENKYISNIDIVPSVIKITGPVSVLNKIGEIKVKGILKDIKDKSSEELEPIIYDKNGSIMDTQNLKLSDNKLRIVYHTLPVKEVPLNIKIKSKFKNGKIIKYSTEPSTIQIAAEEKKLDSINELTLSLPLELPDDIKESNMIREFNIAQYMPKDVFLKEHDKTINVSFTYEPYVTKTLSISASQIKTRGSNKYKILNGCHVTIAGLKEEIEHLTIEKLKPYIETNTIKNNYTRIKLGTNLKIVNIDENIKVKLKK